MTRVVDVDDWRRWAPAMAALLFLWLLLAALYVMVTRMTGGQFTYTIDDPYIHMTLARNLVENGTWGINPGEFASASSSIAWTLLVAATYAVFGVNQYSPLILNFIFATGVALVLFFILRRYTASRLLPAAAVLAIIMAVPLAPLAFTGQEHVLQAGITVIFAYLAALALSEPWNGWRSCRVLWLLALAPLVTLVRYEGLFVIAAVCLLLVIRRRWLLAAAVGAAGILPLTAFGVVSRAQGASFLPNSILLKARPLEMGTTRDIYETFVSVPWSAVSGQRHFLALVAAAGVILAMILWKRRGLWQPPAVMLTLFLIVAFFHAQFGAFGWFYRYEAYVLTLGLTATALALFQLMPSVQEFRDAGRTALIMLVVALGAALLAGLPLADRSLLAHRQARYAANNIFEQQYQVGLFLREHYRGEGVAANDIGAVSYLGEVRLLDLWGLGNNEVAELKRTDGPGGLGVGSALTQEEIVTLADDYGVRVAVVYDEWFTVNGGSLLPDEWVAVGSWTIEDNVITGGDTVTFYAVPGEVEELAANLEGFSSRLPATVFVAGEHTGRHAESADGPGSG